MAENHLKIENPSWWKRRPQSERTLIIIMAILIILIIVLLSMKFGNGISHDGDFKNSSACETRAINQAHIQEAARVLQKVDLTVDPCENFYQFACGNFIKNTEIPPDKFTVTSFTSVRDKVTKQIKALFEKPIEKTDLKPFVLTKTLYQACMNTSEIEKHALSDMKEFVKSTGGWPVVDGENWQERNWLNITYKLLKLGFDPDMFIDFRVDVDPSNSSRNVLILDQPPLDHVEYKRKGFQEKVVQGYYDYMTKIAVAFGAEEQRAEREMLEAVNLDIKLAEIQLPDDRRRDPSRENNRITIKQLEEEFKYVPWLEFINFMLHPYKTMSYDDVIIVKVPQFYKDFDNILATTSSRTIVNYIYWRVIESYVTFLNKNITDLELEYAKIVGGISERPPRWKECTERVSGLYVASGALYIRNFFRKDAKDKMVEMVDYIKDEFTHTIESVDWIDNVTRRHALEKVKSIYDHIAYPDELMDDEKTEGYYEHLNFNASDYLRSMLNLSLFREWYEFQQLDKVIDKKDWRQHSYVILPQAFYSSSENSIEILAGLLQDVFFNNERPNYMNYGAIGHVIGHEITHGFDDKGRQFDKDGNLADWWEKKTKEAFYEKAQCIIDQYSNVTVKEVDLNLNGKNTQGENIADIGGMKHAYLAYNNWLKKHKSEDALPGLPYTPQQMFWISLGNVWCSVSKVLWIKYEVLQDNHPPSPYRVNLALRNVEYFAKDFNCPVGSKMNPKHKCTVW